MIRILVKPGNKATLAKILTLHVMPGQIMVADVADKKLLAQSVEGEDLRRGGTDDMVVNGAKRLSLKAGATGFGVTVGCGCNGLSGPSWNGGLLWTATTCMQHERDGLGFASNLTDAE